MKFVSGLYLWCLQQKATACSTCSKLYSAEEKSTLETDAENDAEVPERRKKSFGDLNKVQHEDVVERRR